MENQTVFDYSDTPNENYNPNKVRKNQCKTCPWRPKSPLNHTVPEIAQKAITEHNHYCHNEQLEGRTPTILCRGTRNYQLKIFHKLGVLAEPTDDCWKETLKSLTDK